MTEQAVLFKNSLDAALARNAKHQQQRRKRDGIYRIITDGYGDPMLTAAGKDRIKQRALAYHHDSIERQKLSRTQMKKLGLTPKKS